MKDIKVRDIFRSGFHFELFLVTNYKGVYNTLELRRGKSVINGYYLDAFSILYKTDLMATVMLDNEIEKDIKNLLTN